MKLTDLVKADPSRLYGIDISTYQGKAPSIGWDKAKAAGLSFCYCKATEGMTVQDSQFRDNYQRLHQAGIPCGAYHFFRGGNDGAKQSDNFLTQMFDLFQPGDLPPVIDVEALNDKTPMEKQIDYILEWCMIVEFKLCVHPVIYTSLRVVRDLFKNTTRFKDLNLWVVDYRPGVTTPRLPPGFTNWYFWQFSDKCEVPGFKGNVDVNRFNGGDVSMNEFLGLSYY
jgi:lysozyme